jgi:hypothetical protein
MAFEQNIYGDRLKGNTSLTNVSGTTFYSGSTNLSTVILNVAAAGVGGSVSISPGHIGYGNALSAITGTTSLTFSAATLQLGAGAAPSFPRDFYIRRDIAANFPGVNISNQNTTGGMSIAFEQGATEAAFFSRYNSAFAGNIPGTSIPVASNVRFQSGSIGQMPLVFNGTPIYGVIGQTGSNMGFRFDATGLTIAAISALHTNNVRALTVGSMTYNETTQTLAAPNLYSGATNVGTLINTVAAYRDCNTTTRGVNHTVSLEQTDNIYNGAGTATWTAPILTADRRFCFFNIGSGAVTFNSSGGGNDLYDMGGVGACNSIVVAPNEAYLFVCNGTYWIARKLGM